MLTPDVRRLFIIEGVPPWRNQNEGNGDVHCPAPACLCRRCGGGAGRYVGRVRGVTASGLVRRVVQVT